MSGKGSTQERVRFCRSPDGAKLALAIHGNGPPLILGKSWLSHLQYDWDNPLLGHLLVALGEMATVVRYDERGYGLSDWELDDFHWRRASLMSIESDSRSTLRLWFRSFALDGLSPIPVFVA